MYGHVNPVLTPSSCWAALPEQLLCAATGAKLFYLSGLRNSKFLAREVLNLARFISVMKFRPLTWRLGHPYLLTDRFEVRRNLATEIRGKS